MRSDWHAAFPYGSLTDSLPPGVTPPEMWPEFGILASPSPLCKTELVGTEPQGIRWSIWPMTFEEYVGDDEPDRAASAKGALARNRIMLWKRIARRDTPDGWHEAKRPWRIDGFFELASTDDYLARWSHNARHDAKLWRRDFLDTHYIIENISFPEFRAAYRKSTAARALGTLMLDTLQRRLALPEREEHTKLWGVRNLSSGEIVAGTGALFSESARASVRECPFILPEARGTHAATGLMDYWFQEAATRGTRTLFSTDFWHPGEPRSWKGSSEFKSHFGFSYVAYPPLLWRFVRGRLR
ncbi:MAG: hypothetical protein KGI73_00065 [Patescibacteria group bacterium]|nr:hypothetical protein [Patescibacteria group bacterium]